MQQAEYNELAEAVKATATRCGAAMALRLRGKGWLVRVACLILLMGSLPLVPVSPSAGAQARLPDEYQIKAAFIYNFAQFIEWPASAFASPDAAFVIGILGDDPFGSIFEQTVAGKMVSGRPVRIQRLAASQDVSYCHILFISASERGRWRDIRQKLKGAGVLTVGDMERFAERGGMIGFVIEENKIRFAVNIEAAERARLKLSSRLLSLAREVRRGVVPD